LKREVAKNLDYAQNPLTVEPRATPRSPSAMQPRSGLRATPSTPAHPELGFGGNNTSEGQMVLASYVLSVGGGGGGGGEPPPNGNDQFLPNTWISL